MRYSKILKLSVVLIPFFLIAACGGGGSDAPAVTSAGSNSTAVKTSGVMTKGSVIVNGVSFAVAPTTAIRVDDNPGVLEDNLKNGMVVRVRGQRNDDGVTGTADAVETENEVQGRVTLVNTVVMPQTFTVLGQIVYVDAETVFANLVNLGGLTAGNGTTTGSIVEVHGLRDNAGNLRATRVEMLGAIGPDEMEIKGIAGNLDANGLDTIEIGGMVVNFNTAAREPAGATINSGDLVEVKGNLSGGILVATLIQREDLEDAEFEPAEGEEVEVEGFMAALNGITGNYNFTVNEVPVQTTSATIFGNGSEEDLVNGAKVEAEGHLSGSTLVARKITFKNKRVEIQATATVVSSNAVEVMGINIMIAPFTDDDGVTLTVSNRYRIRGYDDGGTVIAERIDSGSGGGDDWIKALVTAEDEGLKQLQMLGGSLAGGIDVDLSTAGIVFQNSADEPITEDAFYAGVTAGSTIVKVKFNSGTVVKEVSLED